MRFTILMFLVLASGVLHSEEIGELIFQDDFERSESQELKDEPGNDWTTSSEKAAKGNKQVDLRNGYLHIYTHKEANHATSVRHAFSFRDGRLALKIRFLDELDSIKLNFTDTSEKSVHAGHLFNVEVGTKNVKLIDLKTGSMSKVIRAARKEGTLTKDQKSEISKKTKVIKNTLETGVWYDVEAVIKGDELSCFIDGILIGSYNSKGFAHENKAMIRLLAPNKIDVDELKVWKYSVK